MNLLKLFSRKKVDNGLTTVGENTVNSKSVSKPVNAALDAAAVVELTELVTWIRDTILSGRVVNYDGTLSKWVLPEIVNRCDFTLDHLPNKCYGSIVKMRRVLRNLYDFYLSGYAGKSRVTLSGRDYFEVRNMIAEALREPVRNCEVYHDFDSANEAYMTTHRERPSVQDLVYWLLNGTANGVGNECDCENFDRSELRRALQGVYLALNTGKLVPAVSNDDDCNTIKTMVKAALSKPQRNCDRYFTKDEAKFAYREMVNKLEDRSKAPSFEDWFFVKEV